MEANRASEGVEETATTEEVGASPGLFASPARDYSDGAHKGLPVTDVSAGPPPGCCGYRGNEV